MSPPTKLAPLTTLLLCTLFISSPTFAAAKTFGCSAAGATCNAIVDYVSPNATTLSAIRTLFTVDNLRSILGANNLPVATRGSYRISANQTVKIPFPCRCRNGTGISDGRPVYTVVPEDGLYHIAAEVFSNLVTFPEIQAANNISNPDMIKAGQNLTIPLPCSCDAVDGEAVVHYGRVVAREETVEGIAQQYNITQETLLKLNNLGTPPQLLAGDVLDIPLRVCSSMISNTSLDYPLLVPNNTYAITANSCVECKCNAAMNWNLQCEASGLNASCPSIRCEGSDNLFLGNTTMSGCNSTTCSYAGYTANGTIQTMVDNMSTCPASTPPTAASSPPGSSATSMQRWRWSVLVIFIHAVMLCVLFA